MINRRKYNIIVAIFLLIAYGFSLLIIFNLVSDKIERQHSQFELKMNDYVTGYLYLTETGMRNFTAEEFINAANDWCMEYPTVAALYDMKGKLILVSTYDEDHGIMDNLKEVVTSIDNVPEKTENLVQYESNLDAYIYENGIAGNIYTRSSIIQINGEKYFAVEADYCDYIAETRNDNDYRYYKFNLTIIFICLFFILISIINILYKKSKKLDNTKTAFTSAAAHELKTPLSVIENQCECIMENVAPEKNAEYINSIYTEALRMNKLVASLLQYNRLASADKIKMEKCRLDKIVQTEIEKYQTYFSTKYILLETDIYENAKVKCNAELMSLVIDNYLSNAVKHT
ncbi:MAG: HAMP domain-containing histidine kinase, partial [Eubacterium sp.]|nr:HAMP domain-containing histidine kinase [Eubacterium sp.]